MLLKIKKCFAAYIFYKEKIPCLSIAKTKMFVFLKLFACFADARQVLPKCNML